MMRKILFSMIASLAIAGCSGNDDSTEIAISDEVHFLKDNISLKLGESILLDASRSIKECNLSVKDEFYTSISINGNDAKLITNKVGSTEIYIKYRDAKDTCTVTINPKTSKFGNPVLTLGATRDYVEDQMINYQHGGTLGGFNGLRFSFTNSSDLYYEFDSSDKLVAIKQIIKRSNVSLDDILTSMEERFNYVSSSNNVYWYRHEGVMTARVEKTATETIIRFAKDANIMMQYFPWE